MNGFICPVCASELNADGKTVRCKENHCYDISKSGYINLLMSQKSGNHGDDKLMVRARKDFLDKGYYKALSDKLSETVVKFSKKDSVILDAGCGECYYTSAVSETLKNNNISAEILAIDISKNALSYAKNRAHDIKRAVASIFHMPVADNSCDILTNVFAPFCREEFIRVLKPGGVYIQIIPLEDHLWELKQAVYDKPYKNTVAAFFIEGFELAASYEIHSNILLKSTEDIKNLFMMTPYYYKTAEKDFLKLDSYKILKTKIEFAVLAYRKI